MLWESAAKKANPPKDDTTTEGEQSASHRNLLIAATGSSGLWAIEPSDGTVVWRSRLPDGGVAGPAPIAGALLVSASQLGVYLVSPINGRVIDGIHLTEGVSALPAVYGQHAFVLTNQGQLMGVHVAAPAVDANSDEKYPSISGSGYSRGQHW
jgi:outer membrane protein assembly factor BamB